MRNLGLIGGLGPIATIHYYQQLVAAGAGEMLTVHAEIARGMDFVQRGDISGLASYLARLIERMAKGGAEVAAVSAVTPHVCIRELEKLSVLPLVSIIDETNRAIHARGLRRVALFGTRFTVESRMFGMLTDVEVVVPAAAVVQQIHDAYMATVAGSTEGREVFIRIARELPVDAVVLAGTDLALIFDAQNTPFEHVDCTKAHVEGIVRALG
jgi:aspartate racemase